MVDVDKVIYKVLIAGIDTLVIGYCVKEFLLTEQEWQMILEAKENAQATLYDKGTAIRLRGFDLTVLRTGSGRYKYILSNEDFDICIFPDTKNGTHFPEVQVRFKSQFLWRNGWKEAVKKIDEWLRTWVAVSEIKVSRIDITADFLGEIPALSPGFKEIVTRGKQKSEYMKFERYYKGNHLSGYRFGKSDVLCRIYDKTLEILNSGKRWFESLWIVHGWQTEDQVTRVEFQCRRRIIKRFQINSIEDLFAVVPDMWKYLTEKWLTIRIIQADTHRTRWTISPFWKTVQDALQRFGQVTGVSLLKQLKPKKEILEKQARGLLYSIAALASKSLAGSDIKYGKRYVQYVIRKWLNDSSFNDEVKKRRHKYDNTEY